MNCNICSHPSALFGQARIINKYDISYYQCGNCGFVQTETPYWLDEVYQEAINQSDVGLVGRNLAQSKLTRSLITAFFSGNGQFVDYGGGYGLFVRLMRDKGFHFYRYDKYCDNLFAEGFDALPESTPEYELVTAFELFEHVADPISEMGEILQFSRSIFFSTSLLPVHAPRPGEWWYYGLEHGQHVSIYTQRALQLLAEKFNLNFYTDGASYHLLTEKKISSRLFRLAVRYKVAVLVDSFYKRPSLLAADYERITGHKLV
jgi:hypothetical protein